MGRIVLAVAAAAAGAFLWGCRERPSIRTFWSPDGKSIAYLAGDALFLYDVEAKRSAKLDTGAGAVAFPCWSPDGKAIVFYRIPEEDGPIALGAVDLPAGRVKVAQPELWPMPEEGDGRGYMGRPDLEMIALMALVFGQPMSWSPDGRRLACLGPDPSGTAMLLLDYPAGTTTRVVSTDKIVGWLAWSPDGKRIAYAETELLAPEAGGPWKSSLWVYDVAARAAAKIAELPPGSPVEGTTIVWSADSTQIGFIARGPSKGRATGCLVEVRPGATVRKEVRGITGIAAWGPGLTGIAFVEGRRKEDLSLALVLLYRGVRPPVRKVLGALPYASGQSVPSVPQFSADGRYVSAAVGQTRDALEVMVFAAP